MATRLLFLLLFLFGAAGTHAQSPAVPASQIAARAWVLLDTQSGQLITGYKHDERFEPASLT
ncbi:MAG TPA: D-alanyl-D-alanine carboxypeptidase, partial [Burkholderiales bacterium]|nr:D-alanyl-D-alanine carboxypeptidase [Burkholderiales bacterium]